MYLNFNHNLEVTKNTTYIEKCLDYNSHFHKKGYFSLNYENIAFCLKKGCFIGPQNQRFQLKKGCFFCVKFTKRGVFIKLGYERGILGWGVGWRNVIQCEDLNTCCTFSYLQLCTFLVGNICIVNIPLPQYRYMQKLTQLKPIRILWDRTTVDALAP